MKRISSRRAHTLKIVKRLRHRKYDSLIIVRTICLVIGPFTALYRSFLKHCTLTNKAVGTIWRDLSKPPQRGQGPDHLPLWLLVGTPLVLGPELPSRRAEHSHSGGCLNIFLIYCFYHLTCLCNNPFRFSWLLGLNKEDYSHIFKCVSLRLNSICG